MAKLNLKGIDDLARSLNRSLRIEVNKLFRDKNLRAKVGKLIVEDIKKNVNFGEAGEKTQRAREYLEQFNTTDPAYRRSDIKAVFTGKLLGDLASNVKGFPTQSTFEIAHSKKKHPGYRTGKGRTKKINYNTLSEILIDDLGYDYFQLTEEAQIAIIELVREELFELIAGLNK